MNKREKNLKSKRFIALGRGRGQKRIWITHACNAFSGWLNRFTGTWAPIKLKCWMNIKWKNEFLCQLLIKFGIRYSVRKAKLKIYLFSSSHFSMKNASSSFYSRIKFCGYAVNAEATTIRNYDYCLLCIVYEKFISISCTNIINQQLKLEFYHWEQWNATGL